MEKIVSIQNKKIKEFCKLKQKKYRDQSEYFIVETLHLIEEAKKAGVLEIIISSDEKFKPDILVTEEILKKISNLATPSVIGICQKVTRNNLGTKVLMLNGIQDPGNFGTIIRSAVAFNIDTIIYDENCVDLYNFKTIMSSQGLLFKTNFIKTNLLTKIKELKKQNYQIFATDVKEGKELKSIVKKSPYVIIMGNEGNGVSSEIIKEADEKINIKINKQCESLNVGVATSIILYELSR